MTARRWRDDRDFVAWLLSVEYAEVFDGKITTYLPEGSTIYLWEAWLAGRARERAAT